MTYLLKVFGVIPHDTGIGFSMKKEGEGIVSVLVSEAKLFTHCCTVGRCGDALCNSIG